MFCLNVSEAIQEARQKAKRYVSCGRVGYGAIGSGRRRTRSRSVQPDLPLSIPVPFSLSDLLSVERRLV